MPKVTATKRSKKVRTTVSVPEGLYEEARLAVKSNATSADSINGFIVSAISAYVKLLRRKQIDASFSAMAEDAAYQKEAQLISEQFSASDWEASEA